MKQDAGCKKKEVSGTIPFLFLLIRFIMNFQTVKFDSWV